MKVLAGAEGIDHLDAARASVLPMTAPSHARLPATPQVTTAVPAPSARRRAASASPSAMEGPADARATARPSARRAAAGEVTDRSWRRWRRSRQRLLHEALIVKPADMDMAEAAEQIDLVRRPAGSRRRRPSPRRR